MPVIVAGCGYDAKTVIAVVVHVAIGKVEQVGLVFQRKKLGGNAVRGSITRLHAALIVRVGMREVADKRVEHRRLHVHEVLHFLDGVHVGVYAHQTSPYAVEITGMVGGGNG